MTPINKYTRVALANVFKTHENKNWGVFILK